MENILSRDQFEDEEDVRVNMVDRKEEKTKAVAEVEQKSRVALEKEKQAEKNPEKERDDLTAEVSTSFQGATYMFLHFSLQPPLMYDIFECM